MKNLDLFQIESQLWMAEVKTGVPLYDFSFSPLFHVARPWYTAQGLLVARIGAIADYEGLYDEYKRMSLSLVNSPAEHLKASELEHWYPLVAEFTPKSKVYAHFPSAAELQKDFDYPVFIKGNRQTAKHDPALCIARNEKELEQIAKEYGRNSILHWQKVVVREFVALQGLETQVPGKMKLSFEFRTFWWKGTCVGEGAYWAQYVQYDWNPGQKDKGMALAKQVVDRLQVPFLVVDIALTAQGEWILIECNDAQESGYCGVNKAALWRRVLEVERNVSV